MKAKICALFLGIAVASAAHAGTALLQYEINTGGLTKQCVYDYFGSKYVKTISTVSLCPLSIEVN